MPLALKVQAELDERSLSGVRNQAQNVLGSVGRDAGQEFKTGLVSQLDSVGPSFVRMGTVAEGAMAGVSTGALAASAGIAAIGLAAVAVGKEFYDLGSRFDSVVDSMAIATGKVGADLDGLTQSVKNVARDSASSFEELGGIAARVSQSFNDLKPDTAAFDDLTKQIADLNRMTGESLNVREFGQTLRGFGEDSNEATRALDDIYSAASATGIPIGELVGTLQNVGPAARSLGLDMDETAGLLVSFEQAGLDSSRMLTGLTTAAGVFADNNINMKTGLADTVTQIKQFIDAGNDAAAVDLAGKVFGARSAQLFVDAIRQGKVSVDTLNDGLQTTGDSISQMEQATSDWAETWDKLKNRALDALEPIGTKIFELLNSMGQLILNEEAPTPKLNSTQAPGQPGPGSGLLTDEPQTAGPLPPGSVQVPGGSALPPALGGVPVLVDPRITAPVPTDTLPLTPRDPRTPEDIAGKLDEEKGGSGAKVAVPYGPGYGEPPAPGESLQDWQKRQASLEANHSLAEAQANLTKLEQDNTTSETDLIAARNNVLQARNRVTASELAQSQSEQQALDAKVGPLPGQGAAPRPGQTAEQYGREQSALEASRKRMEAEAQLAQVQGNANATQQELTKAQTDLTNARENEYSAVLRLNEAGLDAAASLNDIGVQLDRDFGLSKGLPGLADNLVRFIGSLAAAPLLGPLSAISQAQGGKEKTGSGLIGMLASQGAFGPQYTPEGMAAAEGGGASTYQMPGAYSGATASTYASTGGNANVNAMLALAQSSSGNVDYAPASDLIHGLADCSGSISDLYEVLTTGTTTPGREFTTTNFASDAEAAKLGFLPGFQPGALNVGVNPYPGQSGHMAATLPNGVNFEGGGGTGGGAQYGGSASGALDSQFEKQYHFPIGGGGPVPVTIVNPPSAPAAPSGPSAAGGTPAAPSDLYSPANTNPGLTNPAAPAPSRVYGPAIPPKPGTSGMIAPALGFAVGGEIPGANPNKGYRKDQFRAPFGPGWGVPVEDQLTSDGWINPTPHDMGGGNWHFGPSLGGKAGVGITIWDILKQNDPAKMGNIGPTDTVPAMLTPGEFVVNAGAASRFGPLLHQINGFQGGGVVPPPQLPSPPPPPPPPPAPVGASAGANVSQHLSPGGPAAPGPITPQRAGFDAVSPIGGAEPKGVPGGGVSGGGLVGAATGAAAMAADMFAPGSGAAVQIASQEIQRAIKFGAQAAGIGVGGLMETFLPFGGSDLANNNWITRVAGGFAGVAPQIANTAGKSATVEAMQAQQQPAPTMRMPAPPVSSGQGAGPAPGPTGPSVVNNITLNGSGAANDPTASDLADHLVRGYATVGRR